MIEPVTNCDQFKKITRNTFTEYINNLSEISPQVENRIFTIRGMQVMIDLDLGELYQVDTKRINEQVRRNSDRFPIKFRFQ